MKTRLLFLGPPGAGKGTQAARLCEANGMSHLSTGDLLRYEVAAGTALGREAEAVMNRGELVSDALVLAIVESQMKNLSEGGWLLDGFPRTVHQATPSNHCSRNWSNRSKPSCCSSLTMQC